METMHGQRPSSNPECSAKSLSIALYRDCQHREKTKNSVLRHAPAENTQTVLAYRQLRRLVFCSMSYFPSTFLRSLRSIPITGLHRYYGRSDSYPVGSSVPYWQHEHRLYPEQVSLLNASDLPIPPSPTTPQSLCAAFARYPSARRVSRSFGSRFHLCTAGSPDLTGRIEFVILRMDHSPPAAPHPASRRRSCIRLQAGERIPGRDFHPSDQSYYLCALAGAQCGGLTPPFQRKLIASLRE